jgi:quinol-cytochrome oxidoreductase complex cytochrome b subunit
MSNSSKQPNSTKEKKLLPFWPHYVLSELIAWYVILGILVTLAAFLPAGLEDRANPLLTPEHVKPEWYFLSVYQFLKVAAVFSFLGADAPRLLGILIPGIAMAALFLLPFWDRGPKRPARQRPVMLVVLFGVLVILIALTLWGQYS